MKQYWSVPELWPGRTIVCIGGGPSLTPAQVERCRGRARVIAVNNAYQLAPWADVLYFCDDKWWAQYGHGARLGDWKGLIVRLEGGRHDFGDPRIKVLKNYGKTGFNDRTREGLCQLRDGLFHGKNSGYQAIGLAAHLGAKRIVLLGYDMQASLEGNQLRTHWHPDHLGGTAERVFDSMLPNFECLVAPLKRRGIEVVNCTPGSKLRCFPLRPLEEVFPAEAAAA